MPVVIHELVVTAELEQKISTEKERDTAQARPLDREELIRECVEQVMKQLQRQQER
jgi:homoserine kinase